MCSFSLYLNTNYISELNDEVNGQVTKWIRLGDERSWINPANPPPPLTSNKNSVNIGLCGESSGCSYIKLIST